MFLGHFAVGFAAKRAAPRASLGTLFMAAQFVDLLWPTLLLLGVERVRIVPGATVVTPLEFTSYPVSHGLLTGALWAVGFGGVYFLLRRYWAGALITAAAVLSHWCLDALVHRADLPVMPGSEVRVGLSLWASLPATIVLECALLAAGAAVYVRTTRARDRIGSLGLTALVVFLLVVYLANLFGPPPPGEAAIAVVGQAGWLLVLWGWWVDRHREARR